MSLEAPTLQIFYQTPVGQWICATLGEKMAQVWSSKRQDHFLGVGYALPYIPFLKRVSDKDPVFMFRAQDAQSWPSPTKNRVVLGCEDFFPFEDGRFDKVLLVHGLELSDEPTRLLREIWRVLKPEGELFLITPCAYSMLFGQSNNPWRKSLPLSEVTLLLQKTFFVILDKKKALFTPFFLGRMSLLTAPFWEKMGAWGLWPLGGVWVIRAQKQVYQMAFPPEKVLCKAPIILVEGGN